MRLLLVLLAAAVGFGLSRAVELPLTGDPAPTPRDTARVTRVVDGDTVVLQSLGKARLIGVDTPEVYGGVECFGREASAYARRLLDGRRVRVRVGADPRDRYGRALVYLWLDDRRMVNEMLVRDGYAQPMTIPPNDEFAPRFVAAARRARRAQRGLWAPGACPRG